METEEELAEKAEVVDWEVLVAMAVEWAAREVDMAIEERPFEGELE